MSLQGKTVMFPWHRKYPWYPNDGDWRIGVVIADASEHGRLRVKITRPVLLWSAVQQKDVERTEIAIPAVAARIVPSVGVEDAD